MADGAEPFDIRDVTRGGRQGQTPQAPQPAGALISNPRASPQARQANCCNAENALGCARSNPRAACGVCCGGFLVLFVGLLFCLGAVGPTQYGIKYNRLTKGINGEDTYRGGRFFIGPLNSFLVFPATVQNLEFSNRQTANAPPLVTRTGGEAGLALTLHVAFQYHLKKDEIAKLYKMANTNYEALFMKLARDTLLKAAAEYTAQQYWEDRPAIGVQMLVRLNTALSASHATCTGLQLLRIELPEGFEQSIVVTQVQKQQIKTNENVQKATVIRASIKVMVAQYQNNITVTLAQANADANYVTKAAVAQASKMRIDAENVALDATKSLSLSPAGLVEYQRNTAYQNLNNATFLYGVSNAVVYLAPNAGHGPPPVAPPTPPPPPPPTPPVACENTAASTQLSAELPQGSVPPLHTHTRVAHV